MIEKDLRARNKSSSVMDYATAVHRNWPKEEGKRRASRQSRLDVTSEQGSEDQLRDMNEFSDDEFELPDIEEMFQRSLLELRRR